MSTEEKLSIFEALRCSIKQIGDDPSALENVEEGLCQLESKFTKYAKSMTEVLQVHSQMKKEIEKLKETEAQKDEEILNMKEEIDQSKKLILKLKREKQRLKKRRKKSFNDENKSRISKEVDSKSSHLLIQDPSSEISNVEGTKESV